MANRDDLFRKAGVVFKQKKEEEEQRKGGFTGNGMSNYPWTALYEPGKGEIVIRLVGLPPWLRVDPTDARYVYTAGIWDDNKKYFECHGPNPRTDEGKRWILHRLMATVLTYQWDKTLNGGKGGRLYTNEARCPDLVQKMTKNGRLENAYEKGWQFGEHVLINVINREKMEWHKAEKRLCILSRNVSEKPSKDGSNTNFYYETGVPPLITKTIWEDIVSVDGNGNWENYDVIVRRCDDSPWYKVFHCVDDRKKIDEESRKIASDLPLTDEETSWEKNDLDVMFPNTPYKTLKTRLGQTFEDVDRTFKTHYFDELLDLVEEEEKASPDTGATSYSVPDTETEEVAHEEVKPAARPAPVVEHPVREARPEPAPVKPTIDWEGLADGTFNGTKYLGVPLLTAQEKAWILGVREDGSFVYDNAAGTLYAGNTTQFTAPELFHVDPLDGRLF
jgi:hypothetical protein